MEKLGILLKDKYHLTNILFSITNLAQPLVQDANGDISDVDDSCYSFEEIVRQTKLFARQNKVNLEFCIEELLAFIRINIAMGLLKLPQLRDYWSTNKVLATPWFPCIMARERFFCILRYLRLVDSSLQKKRGEVGYDALYKMRPLLDHVTAVFPMYYQHEREISINEMMIGTKCRVAFLQYLPKKHTKYGIKL